MGPRSWPWSGAAPSRSSASSGGERGPDVADELLEEPVGFLPDDGLTDLSDLAEHGEIGLHAQTRSVLGRSQREVHPGANPSAHPPVVGLGAHARLPRVPVLLLDRDGALKRQADGTDLDLETPLVRAAVHGLDALDARDAAADRRNV